MSKKIFAIFLLVLAFALGYFIFTSDKTQEEKLGAVFFGVDGYQEEKAAKELVSKLETVDFSVSDAHERINDAYEKKYGSTTLETLNFFGIINEKNIYEIINKYPQIGGFVPFNLFVYKSKDENTTWVARLDPYLMADIVGMQDKELREKFASSFKPLDKLIKETVAPTKEKKINYKALSDEPMMLFEFEIDPNVNLEDFSTEFQERFEELFEEREYIIAGFKNLKETFDDMGLEHEFDAYWTYSLCHFGISNYVFNRTPEAGVFAPCSIFMYIKKGERTIHVGMPKLQNWVDVIGLNDKEMLDKMEKIELEVIETFKMLGKQKEAVKKQVETVKKPQEQTISQNGVNAYFVAKKLAHDTVIDNLKKEGFEILGEHAVADDKKLKAILFTSNELKLASSIDLKGFASVMRVIINENKNEIRITNPHYFLKAFLQKNYSNELAKNIETKLQNAFGKFEKSSDYLDENKLENYHFMVGMPYYEDMIVLSEQENATLLKKAKENAKERLVFELKLTEKSTLLGLALDNEKFVKKIGEQNAVLLPYLVLIENNKAYMLHPKYYIALSYPLLSMSEFMTIASVPGNIENSLKKIFR